jgi:hypothetical protein
MAHARHHLRWTHSCRLLDLRYGCAKSLVDDFARWMQVGHTDVDAKLGRQVHHGEQCWIARLDRLARRIINKQRCSVDITELGTNLL